MVGGGRGDLVAHEAVHGRDVDDAAVSSREHGLCGDGTGHLEGAEEVDVHLAGELLVGDLLRRGHRAGAGVVDEDVDAAEALHDRVDGLLHALRIGHVADDAHRADAVGLLQHRGVFLDHRLAAGEADDIAALVGQRLGHLDAEAGAATGHDSDLAA